MCTSWDARHLIVELQVIMKIRVGKLTLNKREKMSRKIRVGVECPILIH
jgi:hypothetical protein